MQGSEQGEIWYLVRPDHCVLSVRLRKESPGLFLREIGDAENGAQREPSSETVALRHPVMPVTDGFSG